MTNIKTKINYIKNANQHFEEDQVKSIIDVLQRRYTSFADRVNEAGGVINIDLSIPEDKVKTIRFAASIKGMPQELQKEIDEFEIKNPHPVVSANY